MSHYEYNKWINKVDNGIHSLFWSLQADFWVMCGDNLGSGSRLSISRLWVFASVRPNHSSLTVPMSYYEYDKRINKVEIGIHCLFWSLQADVWVICWDNLGSGSPLSISRLWVFASVRPYHSSWTVPMSHYEYNKRINKVEIGIHSLSWSLQAEFSVMCGDNLGSGSPLSISRLWVFASVRPYHSSLTVPMSHYEYNKWINKVEIGIYSLSWSLQAEVWAMVGDIL